MIAKLHSGKYSNIHPFDLDHSSFCYTPALINDSFIIKDKTEQ